MQTGDKGLGQLLLDGGSGGSAASLTPDHMDLHDLDGDAHMPTSSLPPPVAAQSTSSGPFDGMFDGPPGTLDEKGSSARPYERQTPPLGRVADTRDVPDPLPPPEFLPPPALPRSTSVPLDLAAARDGIRARTATQPISAHPQLSFVDDQLRPVSSYNVMVHEDPKPLEEKMKKRKGAGKKKTAGPPPRTVQHPAGMNYQMSYRRDPSEQATVSRPLNALAPNKEQIHASHHGRRAAGGDETRLNLTPLSTTTNLGPISEFEKAREVEARTLDDPEPRHFESDGGTTKHGFPMQETRARYDEKEVGPRLMSDDRLGKLKGGTPDEKALAGFVGESARQIPVEETRSVFRDDKEAARQVDGGAGLLDPIGTTAKPRLESAKVADHQQLGAPSGRRDHYRTKHSEIEQMDNALLFVELMRNGKPGELREHVKADFKETEGKDAKLMTGIRAMGQIRERGAVPPPKLEPATREMMKLSRENEDNGVELFPTRTRQQKKKKGT